MQERGQHSNRSRASKDNFGVRSCGECTLCCKIPRIEDIPKPSWSYCMHCKVGVGCGIYHKGRPEVCVDFTCNWLIDKNIPDNLRPDKIHMYAHGGKGDAVVKIMIDDDHPNAINSDAGACLIEGYRSMGNHVIVVTKDIIRFLCGHGREKPAKLDLDWTL